MPTVETTITVSIPEDGMSLEALERAVAQEVQRAGRELVLAGCRTIEEGILARARGNLRRDKPRPLAVLTRFGWLKLERWHMQDKGTRGYSYPLDQILGLHSRQHASPWVIAQGVALATRLPYRQATFLLRGWLEAWVDYRTVYSWVQRAGAQVIAEEDALQEAVFSRGEVTTHGSGRAGVGGSGGRRHLP